MDERCPMFYTECSTFNAFNVNKLTELRTKKVRKSFAIQEHIISTHYEQT